jgi:predicted O-methyltransferase YrrM
MFAKHREELGKLLIHHNLNGVGVEIGVLRGKFSNHILETSSLSLLVSIDAWRNINHQTQAFELLRQHGKRSVCIKGISHIVSPLFADDSLDFIYIDANHDYDSIKRDLNCWWPKLRSGGLFSGHDYFVHTSKNNMVFGVIEAVNEFAKEHSLAVNKTHEKFAPSWYCFKKTKIKHL